MAAGHHRPRSVTNRSRQIRAWRLCRRALCEAETQPAGSAQHFLRLVAEVFAEPVARADARDDRFLRALVQPLAAALHRGEELVEVDLERREDPVSPVL